MSHLNKISIVVFMMFILSYSASQANSLVDVVYLKNGERHVGLVMEQDPETRMLFRNLNKNVISVEMTEVERIVKADVNDIYNFRRMSYSQYGFLLGHPGILNLHYGHWFGIFGVGVTGGYWGEDIHNIRFNVGVKYIDEVRRSHNLIGYVGYNKYFKEDLDVRTQKVIETTHNEAPYIGLAYEISYRSFYFSLGFVYSIGDYERPNDKLSLGLGYLFRDIRF